MTHVLIVDDDFDLADTLRDVFELQGFSCDIAVTGAAALEKAQAVQYDLVLLDFQLPDMDGINVCKQYRCAGGKGRILMLTGKRDAKSQQSGKDAGVDDFLTKPFTVDRLLEHVAASLKTTSGQQPRLSTDRI